MSGETAWFLSTIAVAVIVFVLDAIEEVRRG